MRAKTIFEAVLVNVIEDPEALKMDAELASIDRLLDDAELVAIVGGALGKGRPNSKTEAAERLRGHAGVTGNQGVLLAGLSHGVAQPLLLSVHRLSIRAVVFDGDRLAHQDRLPFGSASPRMWRTCGTSSKSRSSPAASASCPSSAKRPRRAHDVLPNFGPVGKLGFGLS
jgi:hypothetical protein